MMKRCLSLLLFVALIVALAVPVSADEGSTWTELLELSTVNDSGSNNFSYTTSATVSLSTGGKYRIAYVDILFACTNGTVPTKVGVLYNGQPSYLTITKINDSLARAYGPIVNTFYDPIQVRFERTGSTTSAVEILSFRCNRIATQSFACDAKLYIPHSVQYVNCPGVYSYAGGGVPETVPTQFPVLVYDWQKYDTIVLTGSIEGVGVNSIRATIGTVGVPYEITYTSSNPSGSNAEFHLWNDLQYYSYDDSYKGSTEGSVFVATEYRGKTLFNITIDVSGIDRTKWQELSVYFTGVYYDDSGYSVQIVGVEGMIAAADTTTVTWWNRFTRFMTDLFGGDDPGALDDLESNSSSISQSAGQIQEFEESQQAVLDNNLTQIQTTVDFTNFAAALVFVQKYTNMTVAGISDYVIVFTLPMFLGLFFFLCSRVPGITRWKSPPPRSKPKGGGVS